MYKLNGCCTNCDKEVFEAIERFPSDHKRAREMSVAGPPTDDAVRCFLLLTDGSHAGVTLCKDCDDPDLMKIWQKIIRTQAREEEYRNPQTSQPKNRIESLLKFANEAPLGIIGARPLKEVIDDPRNRI